MPITAFNPTYNVRNNAAWNNVGFGNLYDPRLPGSQFSQGQSANQRPPQVPQPPQTPPPGAAQQAQALQGSGGGLTGNSARPPGQSRDQRASDERIMRNRRRGLLGW